MKKKYIPCFLTLSLLMTMLMPIEVLAGDINTAEQSVVDYCSGTFTYQGKEYQATQESLDMIRSKLMEDDVNLTANQAASARVQFSRKVAEGIEQGYLVEVKDEGNTDIEKPKDDKEEPSNDTEEGAPEEGQEEDGAKDTGTGSDTAGGTGAENGNAGTGSGTAGNAGNGNTSNPGSGSDTTGNPGNGSNTTGNAGNGNNTAGNVNKNATSKTQKQQSSASNKKPEEIKKILKDIVKGKENNYEVLYRIDGKNHVFTSTDSIEEIEQINAKSVVYTIESYQDGTIWVGTKDGTAIFKGVIPIKNTGIYVAQKPIAAAVIILLVLTLSASIALIAKERRGRSEHEKK